MSQCLTLQVLSSIEATLDAREAKLHESWQALQAQVAQLGGQGLEAAELQELQMVGCWGAGGQGQGMGVRCGCVVKSPGGAVVGALGCVGVSISLQGWLHCG